MFRAYFNRNRVFCHPRLTYVHSCNTRSIHQQASPDIQQEIYCLRSYASLLTLYGRARNQKFYRYDPNGELEIRVVICSNFLSSRLCTVLISTLVDTTSYYLSCTKINTKVNTNVLYTYLTCTL